MDLLILSSGRSKEVPYQNSGDENEFCYGTSFPTFLTKTAGGRLPFDVRFNLHQALILGESSVEAGFEPGNLHTRNQDLTTEAFELRYKRKLNHPFISKLLMKNQKSISFSLSSNRKIMFAVPFGHSRSYFSCLSSLALNLPHICCYSIGKGSKTVCLVISV
ncbi:hypothetical protein AVEN_92981-1 [Araneus ventricosus]|uniref:Uncharacterized protein n=1 Tax=Araneus ventricosus TaxID=182803 RepID=A0A4Y2JNY1_ARAVE|nr:hypothetical protein AVEN_92981-1 [Araneus ventricosus]